MPMRTCLSLGGAPVLKSSNDVAAVGAPLDPVGAGRQAEAALAEIDRDLAADFGEEIGDVGAALALPATRASARSAR